MEERREEEQAKKNAICQSESVKQTVKEDLM